MKFFALFIFGILLVGGCSRGDVFEEEAGIVNQSIVKGSLHQTDSPLSIFQEDMTFIAKCGYDTTEVKEYEEYYQVGTEFIFYKSYVKECRETPQPKLDQYVKLSPSRQRIYIEGSTFNFDDKNILKML